MLKYDASSLQKFEGTDAIRKRPTMYVGNTGEKGNQHIIKELIDNSIDEFFAGYGKEIIVTLDLQNGMYSVEDQGRGIPVTKVPIKDLSLDKQIKGNDNVLHDLVCSIHSGGKFGKSAYQSSGGLNGVGLTCGNALSDEFMVVSQRDGYEFLQTYSKGKPTTQLTVTDKSKKTGTAVVFSPDVDVMKTKDIDLEETVEDIKLRSYLNKGLKFTVNIIDKDGKKRKEVFESKEGIVDLVKERSKKPIFKSVLSFSHDDKDNGVMVDIAMSYENGTSKDQTTTFANGIHTSEGGTHLQGFRMGLSMVLGRYMRDNNLIPTKKGKESVKIIGEDYREGLNAVISVRIYKNDLEFQGQTKQKLDNTEAQGAVQKVLSNDFKDWLEGNPGLAKRIAKLVVATAKGRQAAKNAKSQVFKDLKDDSFLSFSDYGKLADCDVVSTTPEQREVFICEGKPCGIALIKPL